MNWLRNRLRAWLGIEDLDQLTALSDERIAIIHRDIWQRLEAIEKQPSFADISRKQFEIDTALREFKEVQAQAMDQKRVPVKTRNGSQFRALMEQER